MKVRVERYNIVHTIRSPKIDVKRNENITYKTFKEGQIVKGYVRMQDGGGFRLAPQIVVENMWAIPLEYVKKIESHNVGGENNDQNKEIKQVSVEAQKEINRVAGRKALRGIIKNSKGSVNGALIGTALGLVAGWYFKKNLFITAAVGMVAGGLAGNYLIKVFKPKPKKEEQ